MLFTLFGAYRKMKKGTFDAKDFAVEQAMDLFKGILVVVSIIALPVLTLLGILGYSNWLIQANGVARFFFWVFIFIYFLWFLISRAIYKRIKRGAEYTANRIVG